MATRVPNRFINPAASVPTYYDWDINHDEEEAFGRTRNVEHTANTGLTGLVRQQGAQDPFTMKLSGTILKKSQLDQFWGYFALCESHTIHFQDFTTAKAEVIITDFQPKRVRAAKNSRDPDNAPLWYWKYTMTMEVVGFISGPNPYAQSP